MTKILTAYMVYKAVDQGKITWDTEVDISDYPFNLTVDSEVSNVPLDSRKYTVKQLLDATLISSANSTAIALAEKISGSESAFVDTFEISFGLLGDFKYLRIVFDEVVCNNGNI